jgi:hypothetical protein
VGPVQWSETGNADRDNIILVLVFHFQTAV